MKNGEHIIIASMETILTAFEELRYELWSKRSWCFGFRLPDLLEDCVLFLLGSSVLSKARPLAFTGLIITDFISSLQLYVGTPT